MVYAVQFHPEPSEKGAPMRSYADVTRGWGREPDEPL